MKFIKRNLLRQGITFFLVCIMFALAAIPYLFSSARKSVLQRYTDQQADLFARDISLFFEPIRDYLKLFQEWGSDGIFEPLFKTDAASYHDTERIKNIFVSIANNHLPQIKRMMIIDADGYEHVLAKTDSNDWEFAATDSNSVDNGPSEQIWFTDTMEGEPGQIDFSGIYRLGTEQIAGITASTKYIENGKGHVIAMDIALSDVQKHVDGLVKDTQARLFMITDDGYIDLNNLSDQAGTNARVHNEALERLIERFRGQKANLPLKSKFEDRWGFFTINNLTGSDAHLYCFINERKLSAVAGKSYFLITGLVLLFVFVSVVMLLLTLRKYNRQVEHIVKRKSFAELSPDQLESRIKEGEGPELEFKSTLRWNLKADRAGKEIELASLKTMVAYLNSDGGTLLIGVEDDGSILGIEADNFPNEDKYLLHFNNLIKQHIGLELSKFILFELMEVHDKKILVVACEKANQPAFLKTGKDEEFYVRVGPGSRKLTMSETLEYIR